MTDRYTIIRWRPTPDAEWVPLSKSSPSFIASAEAALARAGIGANDALAAEPVGETGQWRIFVSAGVGFDPTDRWVARIKHREVIA